MVAALNRLGAVAVLMRPDGPVDREAELGPGDADRRRPGARRSRRRGRRRRGAGARRRAARSATSGRGVIDMERIDPDAGRAAGLVPPEPGPRQRPRLHPLHRRGRAHARQPDHQRALGAVGVRDRLGRGALRRRHGLRGDPDLPPVGAADERRRRGRRRLAAGDRPRLRPRDLLGRGAPLRDHGRLLHLDDAARDRRRPR